MRSIGGFAAVLLYVLALSFGDGARCEAADPFQAGWPFVSPVPSDGFYEPTAFRFAGEDTDSIVAFSYLGLCVFNGDGTMRTGFPIPSPPGGLTGKARAGDIDGDGGIDLVIPGYDIYAYDSNGSLKPGFPIVMWGEYFREVLVLADLNGDGALEIVVARRTSLDTLIVFAFDGLGELVPGWPRSFPQPSPLAGVLGLGQMCAADFDADGDDEVVVMPIWDDVGAPVDPSPMYVLDGNGSVLPGWPQIPPATATERAVILAAVGDLDEDGTLEIAGTTTCCHLLAYRPDGSIFFPPRFALNTGRHIAISDLDGVGGKEIITSGAQVRTFDSQGFSIASTPLAPGTFGDGIAIADVDGDGQQDISALMYSGGSRHVWLLRNDLTFFPGYPLDLVDTYGTFRETTAFTHLDLDDDLELVYIDQATIGVLDIPKPGPYPATITWSQQGNDPTWSFFAERNRSYVSFRRGDANLSDAVDIVDAVNMLSYIFTSAAPGDCLANFDTNDDEQIDIADAIYLLNYLFLSGPPSPPPSASCYPVIDLTTLPCDAGCP